MTGTGLHAGDLDDHQVARLLAHEAGQLLLDVRGTTPVDELKAAGDARSHEHLMARLAALRPGDRVLSEETKPADRDEAAGHGRVWIVDPLDGTREFGEPPRTDWAVHVALWQRSTPGAHDGAITDAAVALPAMGEVHRSDTVTGPATTQSGPIRITASSNRPPAVLWKLRDRLDIEFVRIGSAGAKAMAVVRGDADAYIHAGGQWEWDSAAPAGVLQAAGLHATRLDGSPLRYNRPDPYLPDLLMCRPDVADLLLDAMWLAS